MDNVLYPPGLSTFKGIKAAWIGFRGFLRISQHRTDCLDPKQVQLN
jgi:hypothetical protein